MRSPAEVDELPVGVEADRLHRRVGGGVLHEILDQLHLVGLAFTPVAVERDRYRDVLAHERLVSLDVLAHPRLDRGEVVLVERDAVGQVQVVVEAVVDRRADRDLHARIELEHRLREHMRGVVADQLERLVAALLGDDLDPALTVGRQLS